MCDGQAKQQVQTIEKTESWKCKQSFFLMNMVLDVFNAFDLKQPWC